MEKFGGRENLMITIFWCTIAHPQLSPDLASLVLKAARLEYFLTRALKFCRKMVGEVVALWGMNSVVSVDC